MAHWWLVGLHILSFTESCGPVRPSFSIGWTEPGTVPLPETERAVNMDGAVCVRANLCSPTLQCFYKHHSGAMALGCSKSAQALFFFYGSPRIWFHSTRLASKMVIQHFLRITCILATIIIARIDSYDKMLWSHYNYILEIFPVVKYPWLWDNSPYT